jgi:hypothetical protein
MVMMSPPAVFKLEVVAEEVSAFMTGIAYDVVVVEAADGWPPA